MEKMQHGQSEAYRLVNLAMAYHALGQAAESDAALAILIDQHYVRMAYNIAYVLAYRGEVDRAFEWLGKTAEKKDTGLSLIPVEAVFTDLHHDPRWLPFLQSIGMSPAQLDAIEVNVTLPE